jgi:hypothetical protein
MDGVPDRKKKATIPLTLWKESLTKVTMETDRSVSMIIPYWKAHDSERKNHPRILKTFFIKRLFQHLY